MRFQSVSATFLISALIGGLFPLTSAFSVVNLASTTSSKSCTVVVAKGGQATTSHWKRSFASIPTTTPPTTTTGTPTRTSTSTSSTALSAAVPDTDIIALVVGQENYGLAIVAVGEALWSWTQSPTSSNAVRVLPVPLLTAIVLVAVTGPMITNSSGDLSQIGTGLTIATLLSVGLGAHYILRLIAPYAEVPKEIATVGLLVAVAGFVSFGQNLVVDGFVTLPSISLPSLPSIDLGM